ncbi:DUF6660 family protein [Roseivirga sp.]|uniref:DUF6660 family protein n=1 Tax=Roseivirga sp. TaxID=1964215 RepID=UPI003B8AC5E7
MAIILSILIVSSLNQPCADELEALNSDEITQVEGPHQSDESPENHTDDCSPFCACNCCQTQVHSVDNSMDDVPSFNTIASHERQSLWRSTFSTTIWEPPQLG